MSALLSFDGATSALQALSDDLHDALVVDPTAGRATIEAPGVDLHDLAELLAHVLGEDDWVPSWIPTGLRLRELDLARRTVGTGVDLSMTVEAAGGAGWALADGFVIDGARVELVYGEGGLWANVSGSALIEGMQLDVGVELPDEIFVGRLRSNDATVGEAFLHEHDLVAQGGARQPAGAAPELVDLSVHAGFRSRRFVVHVEARHLIDLAPFELDVLEAEISFADQTVVSLRTEIVLGLGADAHGVDQRISIDTAADIGPDGWSFDGQVELDSDGTAGITCGFLVDGLVPLFGSGPVVVPGFLRDLTIDSLSLSFDSSTRDVSFGCDLSWPDDGVDIHLALEHADGAFTVSGSLTVGGLEFDLVLEHDAGANAAVGVFRAAGGVAVTLADLVDALPHRAPSPAAVDAFPPGASFSVLDAVIAYESGAKLLLAADLGAGVDLTALGHLPLVGPMLPHADTLNLSFRAVLSDGWGAADIETLNRALPDGIAKLPDSVADGPLIDARLELGSGAPFELPIVRPPASAGPLSGDVDTSAPSSSPVTTVADRSPGDVTWIDVDRTFGPLHIGKLGVHYDAGAQQVTVLLGGSVSVAGLTLSVTGLGARYSLADHHLDVSLDGLGIDLQRDPVRITGAFLRVDDGAGHQEFAGKVVIRTEEFSINAIGAFSTLHGSPSLFIYGVLDEPLGGPAFCFVEGLAAGFGYNRAFHPPAIDAVRTFPLVTEAVAAAGGASAPKSPADELAELHDYLPPSVGEYFLAVGVKFNSFKLLDTFAVMVLSFGEHTEIDLIGVSTYQTPPDPLGPLPAMARVELNLLAHIGPAEGVVSVVGQLTPTSYVYNNLCHISGGFAFASWFGKDHTGDFVLSVGGYHPSYRPPPHYPVPPRIAIRYQVTPGISVTGTGYFALTPSVFMAGGTLQASAQIGSVSASFRLAVDFLIGWEPYHYDASLTIDISARWGWFHTSAHAALHIWGPDFSGYATVQWTVISFDVTFGAAAQGGPTPISWERFAGAFLPASLDDACSVRVTGGAIGATGGVPIVNPTKLRLATSSLVPEAIDGGPAIGLAPMDESSLGASGQQITVRRDGDDVSAEFRRSPPLTSGFPAALWGTSVHRNPNEQPIEAIVGYELTPATPHLEFSTKSVRRADLGVQSAPPRTGPVTPRAMELVDLDPDPSGLSAGWIPPFEGANRYRHPELPWGTFQILRSARAVVA